MSPKMPRQTVVAAPPPPPVPTFDDAANAEEYSRKVRRRKSHGANTTGAGAGSPFGVAARAILG